MARGYRVLALPLLNRVWLGFAYLYWWFDSPGFIMLSRETRCCFKRLFKIVSVLSAKACPPDQNELYSQYDYNTSRNELKKGDTYIHKEISWTCRKYNNLNGDAGFNPARCLEKCQKNNHKLFIYRTLKLTNSIEMVDFKTNRNACTCTDISSFVLILNNHYHYKTSCPGLLSPQYWSVFGEW